MDQQEFQLKVIESLAALKTQLTEVVGNGQPGRLGIIETKVDQHAEDIAAAKGSVKTFGIIGGIVTLLLGVFEYLMHFTHLGGTSGSN
jgi:hypothetical protein